MKPVFQTRFGQEPIAPGNCFSACVASILECSLADLPDEATIVQQIRHDVGEDTWQGWPNRFKWGRSWERLWRATQDECLRRGLWMCEVSGLPLDIENDKPWCIISGQSPRGDYDHAVVGRGPEIAHDPYPEGGGLRGDERTYVLFVAINPAVDHTCPECPIDGDAE